MAKKVSLGKSVYEAVTSFNLSGITIGGPEIRGLKKFFGNIPESIRSPYDALENFNATLDQSPLPITDALDKQGKEWFVKSKYKILKETQHEMDRALVQMATEGEISHFYFEGMCNIQNEFARRHFSRMMQTVPIWRVVLKNGKTFSYAYGSWQGGSPILINPSSFP